MAIDVESLLVASDLAKRSNNYNEALRLLEEAHLIAQPKAWSHFLVHWKMLCLAVEFRNGRECFGQLLRLVLAIPGSLSGKAPRGNVGSTKMGIFEERI